MTTAQHDGERHAPRADRRIPVIVLTDDMDLQGLAETIYNVNEYTVQTAAGMNQEHYINARHRDRLVGRVASVLHPILSPVFGQPPQYEDAYEQLAVLAEHLANDHIFADGNKRTALRTTLGLLGMQGVTLDVPDSDDPAVNELYQWIQDIVEHRRDTAALAGFLRAHVIERR
ncbi:MAG: Fic family protein [Bifidobacterium sp.]|nr:Fic family protein [Bifidobacterium sp.]